MPLPAEEITQLLNAAFPGASITLVDTAGDRDHYHLTICSPVFAGKSRVAQHQLVYQALQGHVGAALHALSITTQIPSKST